MKTQPSQSNDLIKELIFLLKKGNAHVSLTEAIKNLPFEDLGKKPEDLPYSIWQITEHIRITQKDILDFSANENYKELDWPADYWPEKAAPKNEDEWTNCIKKINDDIDEFIKLLESSEDILKPFFYGNGQSLLREAMLIADHTSYHTGEIIVLRRLLGNWKSN